MNSEVIEVDFLNKEKESAVEKTVDQASMDKIETKEEKLKRLSQAIDKGVYAPNIDDVAEAFLSDILLDESAKKGK